MRKYYIKAGYYTGKLYLKLLGYDVGKRVLDIRDGSLGKIVGIIPWWFNWKWDIVWATDEGKECVSYHKNLKLV